MSASGTFLGDGYSRDGVYGFIWAFTCERCGRTFRASTPELSAPVVCHGCFTGSDPAARRKRDRERKRQQRKAKGA